MIDFQPCALRFSFDHHADRIPGLASGSGDRLRFGKEAAMQMRLFPQEVFTGIWDELSVDPMQPPLEGFRHLADLAIAQLRQIDPPKEHQICLVPSWWQREQLGVLLSVLQASQIHSRHLMPRSLALAATRQEDGKFWILEQSWHQVVLTRFRSGRTVKQVEQISLPHHGALDCLRSLARRVAERCLEEHRVDPLYSAESDQNLFNALLEWIRDQEGDLPVSIGRKHFVIPGVRELLDHVMVPVNEWVRSVCGPRPCFAESTLASILRIPECRICDEASLVGGLLPSVATEGVGLIEEIFSISGVKILQVPETTHVVFRGVAYALDSSSRVELPDHPPCVIPSGVPGERFHLEDGEDVLRIHVP